MKAHSIALYARVSTEMQAKDHTVDSQVQAVLAQAGRDGVEIPEGLRFIDDGFSGSTLARPGLERLRDLAATGALETIYVHSPDRLARDFVHQVLLTEELNRAGVELHFVNRPVGKTLEDALLLQVQGIMAEYEKGKLLERVRRGRRHAAQCGSANALSAAPYGFRYVSKAEGGGKARLEVEPAQAAVVRRIFDWVTYDRLSINEVQRRLRASGVPSPEGKPVWCSATISHLLAHPAYVGEATFGRQRSVPWQKPQRPRHGCPEFPRIPCRRVPVPEAEWIHIPCPALVDRAQFEIVRELLKQNKDRARARRKGASNLLQGLLACQQCGYAYTHRLKRTKDAKGVDRAYRYYECTGRNQTKARKADGEPVQCSNRAIDATYLDNAVWDRVKDLLKNPARVEQEYFRRLREVESQADLDLTPVRKQITRTQRALDRLIDAYVDGQIERTEFEPRAHSIRQQISRLKEQEKEMKTAVQMKREIRYLVGQLSTFSGKIAEGLDTAEWETRRQLIRILVKHIEVHLGHVTIVFRVGEPSIPSGKPPHFWQHCSDSD